MGRSRGTGSPRFRLFMWIATALWLVGAIAAIIDRDTLNAVAWFGFAAFGALTASGSTERSRGLAPGHRAFGRCHGDPDWSVPRRLGAAMDLPRVLTSTYG